MITKKKPSREARAKFGALKIGMMQPGQAVKRQHAEDRREGSQQHRHLERDRHERGPAIEGPAADIQRVVDHRRVPLQEEAEQTAGDAADQVPAATLGSW